MAEANERHCPNCDDPTTVCNGSYSQSCWKRRCEKIEEHQQRIHERVSTSASVTERVSYLETLFAGALLDHAAEHVTAKRLPLVYRIRSENLGLLLRLAREALAPFDLMIHCPMCKTKHVDEGEFEHREHHTHSCQGYTEDAQGKRRYCGHTWRPAKRPTRGVAYIEGFVNEPRKP